MADQPTIHIHCRIDRKLTRFGPYLRPTHSRKYRRKRFRQWVRTWDLQPSLFIGLEDGIDKDTGLPYTRLTSILPGSKRETIELSFGNTQIPGLPVILSQ